MCVNGDVRLDVREEAQTEHFAHSFGACGGLEGCNYDSECSWRRSALVLRR